MLDLPTNPHDTTDPFRGTSGPRNARVMIVGEAYGENEDRVGRPFVGESGKLLRDMLRSVGIDPEQCLFTNVINRRPESNNFNKFLIPSDLAKKGRLGGLKGLFPTQLLQAAIFDLERLIQTVQPDLIITLGNYPFWALTPHANIKAQKDKRLNTSFKNPTGIDSWRGSMLEHTLPDGKTIPLLPTYHPAAILRNWSWHHIAVQDLRRASRFLRGGLPWHDTRKHEWIIRPKVAQVIAWIDRFLAKAGPRELVLDLETFRQQIHIFGIRDERSCLCIPFMDIKHVFGFKHPQTTPCYTKWEFIAIYEALRKLLTNPRVTLVGQNILYDAQFLSRYFSYVPKVSFDTMVAQHILFADDPKGLDFMASIYCDFYRYWKEDRKESIASDSTEKGCEYNCLDLEYTAEVRDNLELALTTMKRKHLFADRMELYHILLDMMLDGVRVDVDRKQGMGIAIMLEIQRVTNWLEIAVPQELKPPMTKTSPTPWYSSNDKLGVLLYDTYGLRAIHDEKTGARTVKKEALYRLVERYPSFAPLLNAITIYRSLRVFAQTFISASTDHDSRWRTYYNPAGPETFRLSSAENVFGSGLNLQNIPREREDITIHNALEVLQ